MREMRPDRDPRPTDRVVEAPLDQTKLIREISPGIAALALDPVPADPRITILSVQDPATTPWTGGSIALDPQGLFALYIRVRELLINLDDAHRQAVQNLDDPVDDTGHEVP